MGYSTEFQGELKFTKDITGPQLAKLKDYLGEDCRDHPEWDSTGLTYIDLELTEDYSGLRWNGAEKTYDLVEKVNFVIKEMQKTFPDFGLEGELMAQGEDMNDRWVLKVENNIAESRKILVTGNKITCPHCGEEFILENKE